MIRERLIGDPILKGKPGSKWHVEVKVLGGGLILRLKHSATGFLEQLVLSDLELRGGLKTLGYLKRDPRAKERRKFGLKKARKAPQWSKR